MNASAQRGLMPEQLRLLSSFFATGVTAVLSGHDGECLGMTVNSFTSLSLDPPLVLFGAQSGSSVLQAIRASGCFTVNVLATDQTDISSQLARRGGPEKMQGIDTVTAPCGAPRLTGALAWFECALERCEAAGDHLIVIGRVLDGGYRDMVSEPLLFFRSAYRALRTAD
ncbi:MAG: flavin reductase family protein [Immundisolibacter sp.]|uniref:flavin reductase family protein n=1 Tax=Immundisolibacter sp. TaxID=1934948 RepID=UPI003EDE95B7